MVKSTQDSHPQALPALQDTPGDEPDSGAPHAAEAQPVRRDYSVPEGPRELGALAIGVGLLVIAFVFFWIGLYLPNHVAVRTLLASFGTFGVVWLLFRLRIFQKPHGSLIAVGTVALFAAVVPFVERGFRMLDSVAKAGLAGDSADPSNQAVVQPAAPVPAPVAPPPEPVPVAPPEEDVVRELIAPAPDPAVGRVMRLKQDTQVVIGGRKFLIRAGSQFPFKSFSEGNVTFVAAGQDVTIAAELVAFTGQSQETPEEITKLAMDELRRRYPNIFEKGTPENDVFVGRTRELKVELPDLFSNPRWPLEIGEQLAAQEGWRRADKAMEGTPENAPTEPADPPALPNRLPVNEAPPLDTPQLAPN
jgi:hypothetical protein